MGDDAQAINALLGLASMLRLSECLAAGLASM
jgi:hypothetical protein